MGVYKSQRKEAVAEFLKATAALQVETMRIVKKLPKSYRYIISNLMLELTGKAHVYAVRANSIFVYGNMPPSDFDTRHYYLMKSAGCLDAICSEIGICYALVRENDNIFKSKKQRESTFFDWTHLAVTAAKLIKGVIKSDKARYKRNYDEIPPLTPSEIIAKSEFDDTLLERTTLE